jgi:hypothetical protein
VRVENVFDRVVYILYSPYASSLVAMKWIELIILVSAAFCVALTGCAHSTEAKVPNQQMEEEVRAEMARSFELERRADMVIYYERSDRIELWANPRTTEIRATDETLSTAVSGVTTNRDLVVVILGKLARYELSEAELRAKVDAIEAVLKAQGFKRVVFQLTSASRRSVYRE